MRLGGELGGCICCSRVRLLDPMDCSSPGFLDLHYLPEFAQTHAHWVSDAIQPSHPLSSSSFYPQCFPASGSFPLCIRWPKYWRFSSAPVFPINIQDWFPLRLTGLISLLSRELSWVFSNTTFWKRQFSGTQPSLWWEVGVGKSIECFLAPEKLSLYLILRNLETLNLGNWFEDDHNLRSWSVVV